MLRISIFCLILIGLNVFAQTSSMKKSIDMYNDFLNNKSVTTIEKSYNMAQTAILEQKNAEDAFSNFYYGVILKTYYDNMDASKKNSKIIFDASNSLMKTLSLDPKFDEKENTLNFLKFSAYDLYNIGVNEYNNKSFLNAFLAYDKLLEIKNFMPKVGSDLKYTNPNTKEVSDLKENDILNNYIVFASAAGKDTVAIDVLEKLIQKEPLEAYYLQVVNLYIKNKQEDKAKATLVKATAKYPNSMDLNILEINMDFEKREFATTESKINNLIANNPKNADLYNLLGGYYETTNNIDKAIEAYRKGISIDDSNYNLNYNYGVMCYNEGKNLYSKSLKNNTLKDSKYKITSADYMKYLTVAKSQFQKCLKMKADEQNLQKLINIISEIK